MKNKQQLIENPEKGSKRQNREMAVVTYLVMAIFFILAGYMVYFIIHDSDQVLNNSANKRQELLAKRVTKGKILSDKGNVLAKTVTDSSGNETRKYPYGSLFAHVVGRSSHGKTGLEASESYTMLTSGLNPFLSTINELKGKKNPGNNVVTTLNVGLSKAASNALGSKRGAVVVMDPETGKVLAMVSKPSYDPNQLTDARWNKLTSDSGEQSALYNRATQGLYPPGSTFKLYTAFEFMREQDNYSKFHYTCTGKIGTGSEQIKCYGGEVHGKVDLEKAFAESCNAAFCSIGDGLNRNSWRKLCESFYYNKSIPLEKMELSYRHSFFSERNLCITSVKMKLAKGEREKIKDRMDTLMERRKDKQPLEYPSAGSTFKRPEGDFAARLIEVCGLKGTACGGAEVSTKHSGFIINKDNATFDDVMGVVEIVKQRVKEQTGVTLECEVLIMK